MLLQDLFPEHRLDAALAALDIAHVQFDSRKVAPGDLFFALAGTHVDGARFAPMAADKGAAAIVAGSAADLADLPCPVIRVDDPARALALAAAVQAGPQPATVVGVTGTSGKSSVVNFLRQIWQACGREAAAIGTIGITRADGTDYGGLTTPDPVSLQTSLAALAADGVDAVALEASSHGISQRRLDGIRFAAGGFTNLGRDHMDYHPTVEDYFAAKMRLFETLLADGAPAVIDADGTMAGKAADVAGRRGLRCLTVGENGDTLRLVERRREPLGQRLTIAHDGGETTVLLPLIGDFQASNALVAAGLAVATGTAVADALAAIGRLQGTPGRVEWIGATPDGAPVFVDYAHKPDALAAVLTALRPYAKGRLVAVFGAGGDRDPGKRPIMGQVAQDLSDVAIVTDDNPRSEDPAAIRAAILAAAPDAVEIGDRRDAIRHGVDQLRAGDILVIAGKGHEPGQIVGNRVLPFSDQEEARAALAALGTAT